MNNHTDPDPDTAASTDARVIAALATLDAMMNVGFVSLVNAEEHERATDILCACFAEFERSVLYTIAMGRAELPASEPDNSSQRARRFAMGANGPVFMG